MEREQLVEKLVSTLHLSVPERQMLAPVPVRDSEVRAVVKRLLGDSGYFPAHARPWLQGKPAFEGYFLESLADGRFRLWWQRSDPINPTQMAEQHHVDFSDIDCAIEAFVKSEWPRGIDGIRIVP